MCFLIKCVRCHLLAMTRNACLRRFLAQIILSFKQREEPLQVKKAPKATKHKQKERLAAFLGPPASTEGHIYTLEERWEKRLVRMAVDGRSVDEVASLIGTLSSNHLNERQRMGEMLAGQLLERLAIFEVELLSIQVSAAGNRRLRKHIAF